MSEKATKEDSSAKEEPGKSAATPSDDTPKGHPAGLYRLFFTEMWERFSYYGMRALLVPYMVQFHGWQPGQASSVYKWYTSLVYLTPLLGGFLADRYLGLRSSILIGGILMAIGHFLMAFEPLPMFYLALAFLIAGNGFFKPNISTLVGKMYKEGDARRDRAFTIFYMGINIGAFVSSIACPWLRATYGFHYGFGLAGIGMVIGLLVFVVSQRRVIADVEAAGNALKAGKDKVAEEHAPEPDEAKPGVTGLAAVVSNGFPFVLLGTAVLMPGYYLYGFFTGANKVTDIIMPIGFGFVFAWMGITLRGIKGASKDKSVTIFVLFVFSVIFWMAFEQAGNALNLWAEYHTDLSVAGKTYPAGWWQSVNALLIFILAPLFAVLWGRLNKAGKEPSTPMKMLVAMVLIGVSFAPMLVAAKAENGVVSRVPITEMPEGVDLSKVNAGRLTYEAASKELVVHGVLPRYVTNEILKGTAPEEWLKEVDTLEEFTRKAGANSPVTKKFEHMPAGFRFPWTAEVAKENGLVWNEQDRSITFTAYAEPPARQLLEAAGGTPSLRDPLWELEKKSVAARVSGVWLFLCYLFATLGELCLSPVGLSMVTKLAPGKFASVFMGVWLLSSSVAQYVGGSIGEQWGILAPTSYFWLFIFTSAAGFVVLALLVNPLKKMMHNVT